MLQFTIIILLGTAAFALSSIRERQRMRRYLDRSCTGFQWRRRFPQSSKPEIREFLDIFVEAFGFQRRWRLCFAPDDRVMEVYRTLYPPNPGGADGMELESFADGIRKRYGVDLRDSWREDITLAEIYASTFVD
jgi:propanediol dehydratase small subunit